VDLPKACGCASHLRTHICITDVLTGCLQSVQNAVDRLVTGIRQCDHISLVLRQLLWLPVRQHVIFEIATSVHRSLSGNARVTWSCRLVADARIRQIRQLLVACYVQDCNSRPLVLVWQCRGVTWPTTVSSLPTPVSDDCVLPTLEHSLSVGHVGVLETGPLPPQNHKSGTVWRPISDYVGCHTASSGGY